MTKRLMLSLSVVALAMLFLAACGSTPAPTAASATSAASSSATIPSSPPEAAVSTTQSDGSSTTLSSMEFEKISNTDGSVTVDIKPTALAVGQPATFHVAMNTHSVDLSDDMTQVSILRDDTGKEYRPTAWEGAEPGGHHRAGNLEFGSLTGKPRYVELIIKGMAKVPERVFRWDLAQ